MPIQTKTEHRHLHSLIQIIDRPKTADDTAVVYSQQSGLPTEVEIMKVGTWNYAFGEPVIIEPDDLDEMVENFRKGVRKGVAFDCDHNMAQSTGWVQSLRTGTDSNGVATLYATVDWTPLGAQLLTDKIYKFFSPEWYETYQDPENGDIYENVLTGGALTNRPLMKSLAPLVAGEESLTKENPAFTLFIDHKNNLKRKATENMDLATIRSKEKADLTTEELDFLKTNSADLTPEEATKFEITPEPVAAPEATPAASIEEPKPAEEPNTAGEKVTVTKAELAALRLQANEGSQAFAQLKAHEAKEKVRGWVASEVNKDGKFTPAVAGELASFYNTLSPKQASDFEKIVGLMPSAKLFSEFGKDGGSTEANSNAAVSLSDKAKELMASEQAAGRKLEFSDALKQVTSSNAELVKEHKEAIGDIN